MQIWFPILYIQKTIPNISTQIRIFIAPNVPWKEQDSKMEFWSKHEADILLHQAVKRAFDELNVRKLPKVKDLQSEYAALLAEKKAAYADYQRSREEMREPLAVKANVDQIMGRDGRDSAQEKEHGQR